MGHLPRQALQDLVQALRRAPSAPRTMGFHNNNLNRRSLARATLRISDLNPVAVELAVVDRSFGYQFFFLFLSFLFFFFLFYFLFLFFFMISFFLKIVHRPSFPVCSSRTFKKTDWISLIFALRSAEIKKKPKSSNENNAPPINPGNVCAATQRLLFVCCLCLFFC